jgi:hypothetical protein
VFNWKIWKAKKISHRGAAFAEKIKDFDWVSPFICASARNMLPVGFKYLYKNFAFFASLRLIFSPKTRQKRKEEALWHENFGEKPTIKQTTI